MSEADAPGAPSALIGKVVAERYHLLAILGQGAMGTVYSAWHLGLEHRVAFKLLRRQRSELDTLALQRFQREARAAARIQSEYVCRVIDNGTLEDGTPFLVMEHLDGRDLAAELAQRGRLPLHEAVRYMRQACFALAAAHREGIVHRDLKPANMFLHQTLDSLAPGAEWRRLKVLDFGISKESGAGTSEMSLTGSCALLGSPLYMSPEQLNSSRDVDGRSDVWALGVILYQLITGKTPFQGQSIAQLVDAVLHRTAPPCACNGVKVPVELEVVIGRALRRDRGERYQSVLDFANALAPFEEEAPCSAEPESTLPLREGHAAGDAARASAPSLTHSAHPALHKGRFAPNVPRRSKRGLVLVLSGVLIAGLGLYRSLSAQGSGASLRVAAPKLRVRSEVVTPSPLREPRGADEVISDDWLDPEPDPAAPVESQDAWIAPKPAFQSERKVPVVPRSRAPQLRPLPQPRAKVEASLPPDSAGVFELPQSWSHFGGRR